MTLITNEIHMFDGFRKTLLVFGADRRISKPDGRFDSLRRKLFRIPYLDGGISYFGLATVYPKRRAQYMSEWLANFISKQTGVGSLQAFAIQLRDELHRVIPPNILKTNASGFHICGYNAAGIPEFWFLTNIGGMSAFQYTNLQSRFAEPSSDFLERDAKNLGWDGVNPGSIRSVPYIYRNGDFRAHAVAWEALDKLVTQMGQFQDFKNIKTPTEYAEWLKFKFEVIAYFYKKRAKKQLIGRPIDVFCLTKSLP